MQKLTTQMLKDLAKRIGGGGGGVEILGVGNIERFDEAPQRMHPKNIFPECRSVITIVQPIPRGSYRGITEGTHFSNYTFYSYSRLNGFFRPQISYEIARYIEDCGYEAVPVFPGVPEHWRPGARPLVPGRPAPEINLNIRVMGVGCGLGEIGWSKVFLHPVYGPRVRLGNILTDAVLEPDPMIEPGTICKRCMRCAKLCPGNAIPAKNEKPPVKIRIGGKEFEWGDVHMGRCTATHHGLNYRTSPFLKRYLPGFGFDPASSEISEDLAYKISHVLAGGEWMRSAAEFPGRYAIPYYRQIREHTGYFAVCGAKGCIRGCMEFQEKAHVIEQDRFNTPVFPGKMWELLPPETDQTGGIAEGKVMVDEFQKPDTKAGQWE